MKLYEYRCKKSNALLCKIGGYYGIVEIMNRKNRFLNYVGPTVKSTFIGPKGADLQRFSKDLYCKGCQRFLGRALGDDMHIEIKCHHCKEISTFFTKEIYEVTYKAIHGIARENLKNQIKNLTSK